MQFRVIHHLSACLLAADLLLAAGCEKTPPSTAGTSGSPDKPAVSDKPNLPFTKEGELVFMATKAHAPIQLDIEVANNEAETTQGLMFRQSMADNQGMLFIFDGMEPRSFWMKNTYIPLDIIFIDAGKHVVSVQKNAAILNENSLPSEGPAQFVLEVNGGWCDKNGIQKGDLLDWRY